MNANEKQRYLSTDISQKEWVGEIISVEDPMKMLRVKARIFGLFDSDDMTEDMYPWIFPANVAGFSGPAGGNGSFDVPAVGTFVKIKFPNGDIYSGQYTGIPNINEDARNTILAEEYEGVHVMRYDSSEDFQIYYTPLQGVVLKLKEAVMNISKDQSITFRSKDGNFFCMFAKEDEIDSKYSVFISADNGVKVHAASDVHVDCGNGSGTCTIQAGTIELGDDGCAEQVVLGTSFKQIFDNHTHIGFLGIPTAPAMASGFTCPLSNTTFTKR